VLDHADAPRELLAGAGAEAPQEADVPVRYLLALEPEPRTARGDLGGDVQDAAARHGVAELLRLLGQLNAIGAVRHPIEDQDFQLNASLTQHRWVR